MTFQEEAKAWVKLYSSVYQKRDVTYYMHVMEMHVATVLTNHGYLKRKKEESERKKETANNCIMGTECFEKKSQCLRS